MRVGILVLLVFVASVGRAADTNLVDVLRRTQRELDVRDPRGKPAATNQSRGTATGTGAVLAQNDTVELVVEDEPDLSIPRAVVSTNGTIPHPLLGNVPAAGKSTDELANWIREALARDYLVDPRVKVRLLALAQSSFSIRNQVVRPGTYTWSTSESMTILKAIGLAGGPTRSDALSRIVVLRSEGGQKITYRINLDELIHNPNAKPFLLRAGDVVEVGQK